MPKIVQVTKSKEKASTWLQAVSLLEVPYTFRYHLVPEKRSGGVYMREEWVLELGDDDEQPEGVEASNE